ncbi:PREDICTED: zinc finger protein 830 [Polistes dominula]|uniref:Zinc finger protein 830 n=1 Tax=Polistes dominula TaxID=743375 RepID=A0ABM1J8D8_POLDO|nr:PREDICTED: zinc finger protein 830 [Polistes dominula]
MTLKRKLTQEDLRKAMSEHKKKFEIVKKIESPLAKYTDAGQLMCILCKSIVRSETVWAVHINSKTHKENVLLAKKTKLEFERPSTTVSSTFKRPSSPLEENTTNKKIKGILKNPSKPLAQSNLPADFFDDSSKQSSVTSTPVIPITTQETKNSSEETNSDTENRTHTDIENNIDKEKEKVKETNQAALPEGFFDDPIMDAKVRNVEYKDPIEEEWEKFQKEIKEETAQSAQIIADDQEEATTERQRDEIEEQIRYWSRVMDFIKRKEQVQATDRKLENVEDDMSTDDETEFDEFLDWRAKNSYK